MTKTHFTCISYHLPRMITHYHITRSGNVQSYFSNVNTQLDFSILSVRHSVCLVNYHTLWCSAECSEIVIANSYNINIIQSILYKTKLTFSAVSLECQKLAIYLKTQKGTLSIIYYKNNKMNVERVSILLK